MTKFVAELTQHLLTSSASWPTPELQAGTLAPLPVNSWGSPLLTFLCSLFLCKMSLRFLPVIFNLSLNTSRMLTTRKKPNSCPYCQPHHPTHCSLSAPDISWSTSSPFSPVISTQSFFPLLPRSKLPPLPQWTMQCLLLTPHYHEYSFPTHAGLTFL